MNKLQTLTASETLLLIPCSKSKRPGGASDPWHSPPWPAPLLTERRSNLAKANADERHLMPAWHRYTGGFYTTAAPQLRDAVTRETPLLILSGGYGLLHPQEPIGDYNKIMRLRDWKPGLLEDLLISEALSRKVTSVVAFAARSSDYAKLVGHTPWEREGIDALLVTIKNAGRGASGKVPRALGQAFSCFWQDQDPDRYPKGTAVVEVRK
ncbi:hypothetical protein AB0J52_04295 [Spirillospora sp. NPDC049652]